MAGTMVWDGPEFLEQVQLYSENQHRGNSIFTLLDISGYGTA
jgi:hypothetical protein